MSVVAAYLLASTDDEAGAIALLRDAFVRGYRDPGRLRHSPFFANLRDTAPAFEALMTEIDGRNGAAKRALILNDPRLETISPGLEPPFQRARKAPKLLDAVYA